MREQTPTETAAESFATHEAKIAAFKTKVQKILHTLTFFKTVFKKHPFAKGVDLNSVTAPLATDTASVEHTVRQELVARVAIAYAQFEKLYENAAAGVLPDQALIAQKLEAVALLTKTVKEYFGVTEEEIATERRKEENKVVPFPTSSKKSV